MGPATLTVLWYGGASLLDRLIHWFTGSPYSHVAVFFNGVVYEETARGIVAHAGATAQQRAATATAHRVVPLGTTGGQTVIDWLSANNHDPYNFVGLITAGIAALTNLELTASTNQSYDCSGWTAELLAHLGYVFPKDSRDISPGDLARYLAPITAGPPAH